MTTEFAFSARCSLSACPNSRRELVAGAPSLPGTPRCRRLDWNQRPFGECRLQYKETALLVAHRGGLTIPSLGAVNAEPTVRTRRNPVTRAAAEISPPPHAVDRSVQFRRRVVVRQMAARFQSPAQFRIQALSRASETVDRGDAK